MKTVLYAVILFLATSSCDVEVNPTYEPASLAYSSEEMAKQVVTALQHVSSQEYVALFPTLKEFHLMMEMNSVFYGEYLSAAKQEFSNTYQPHLITAVKESFDRIIREGTEKGIAWNTISFERIESSEIMKQQFGQAQVAIVFSTNGKAYRLILKKALIVNAKWKVSQFIELV